MADIQLDAASALLEWMQSPDQEITLHPALIIKRDPYNGLGIFVRDHHEVNCALQAHISAEGHKKWLGVAPDELLFSIPRTCMLEAMQQPVCSQHNQQQESQQAGGTNADLAAKLVGLARHRVHSSLSAELPSGSHDEDAQGSELLQRYLASIPGPQDLAGVLPILWAVANSEQVGPQQQQTAQESRLQHLARVVAPSPSACQALHQQLQQLRAYLHSSDFNWDVFTQQPDLQQQVQPNDHERCVQQTPQSSGPGCQPDVSVTQCWAQGVCWSRAIQLWGGPTLVPVADFMNHSHPPNVMCMARTKDDAEDGSLDTAQAHSASKHFFECYAVKPLAPGQELHWVYLAHSHDAGWLSSYGFVPQDGRSSFPSASHVILPPDLATDEADSSMEDTDSDTDSADDDSQTGGSCGDEPCDGGPPDGPTHQVHTAPVEPSDIEALLPGYDAALEHLSTMPDTCQMPAGLMASLSVLLVRERQAVVDKAAKHR